MLKAVQEEVKTLKSTKELKMTKVEERRIEKAVDCILANSRTASEYIAECIKSEFVILKNNKRVYILDGDSVVCTIDKKEEENGRSVVIKSAWFKSVLVSLGKHIEVLEKGNGFKK